MIFTQAPDVGNNPMQNCQRIYLQTSNGLPLIIKKTGCGGNLACRIAHNGAQGGDCGGQHEKKKISMQTHNYRSWKYVVIYLKPSGCAMTGVSWDAMVKVIIKRGVSTLRDVKFDHPNCPGGSAQIPGNLMLILWKAVSAGNPLTHGEARG